MTAMKMTHHARKRSQQRAISPFLINLLLDFGKAIPAGDGASKMFFDKSARRRVRAYVGSMASLIDEHLDVYLVVGSEGQIVTAAHLTERIHNH